MADHCGFACAEEAGHDGCWYFAGHEVTPFEQIETTRKGGSSRDL